MDGSWKIESVKELNIKEIQPLIERSLQENFKFLIRLKEDWMSGTNQFNQTNEELCQIKKDEETIAIGGINNNPYSEAKNVGRIRHLYILPEYRRQGVGKKLMLYLLEKYGDKYEKITLRTDTKAAATFYESLGFKRISSEKSTHEYSQDQQTYHQ